MAFTDAGVPVPWCAAQPVSTAGTATCQAVYQSPGRHQLTAAYSGDAGYAASTSAALAQQVSYRVQQVHGSSAADPGGPAAAVTVELLDAAGADVFTAGTDPHPHTAVFTVP